MSKLEKFLLALASPMLLAAPKKKVAVKKVVKKPAAKKPVAKKPVARKPKAPAVQPSDAPMDVSNKPERGLTTDMKPIKGI